MPRKKKQQKAEDAGGGWMMTYADLMSLLMAFFVMLLASAEVDKAKFEEMGKSMRLALGAPLSPNAKSVSDQLKLFDEQTKKKLIEHVEQQEAFDKKLEQTKVDAARLREIFKDKVEGQEVEVVTHGRMIIIRLLAAGVFKSGEAEILPEFWPTIQKMKNELKTIEGDIIISGYTDNIPINTPKYRSNWELSAARAYSVITSLIGGMNLPPERFVLRGFGETRPMVNNDTEKNRAKNRRVELLIDQREPADDVSENHKDKMIDGDMPDAPLPKDLGKVGAGSPAAPISAELPILNS